MSILVVDDQPVNRVVIGKLLRSLDLHVIEASDGQQGVAAYLRYGRSVVSCIFLDLMMPVLDGFKAAMSIRSAESQQGWLPVPILAFTSEDVRHGSPMWQQCMQSGFNDVVPKPMNKRHATQMLCRWLPDLDLEASQPGSGLTVPHASSCAASGNSARSSSGEDGAVCSRRNEAAGGSDGCCSDAAPTAAGAAAGSSSFGISNSPSLSGSDGSGDGSSASGSSTRSC